MTSFVTGQSQPESPHTPYSDRHWHWHCTPRPVFEPSVLDVHVNSHTLRPLRKLGEGGYAYVYLVKPVSVSSADLVDVDARYGLKKVIASTPERLEATQREIDIQTKACHPSLLPLLDWAVVPTTPTDADSGHTVYMLTPAYPDGSLAEELTRMSATQGSAAAAGQGSVQGTGTTCVLSTRQVLGVFRQLCLALDALHGTGYAHRDVKTHNVLIKRPSKNHNHLESLASGKPTYPQYYRSQSGYQVRTPTLDTLGDTAQGPAAPTTPTAGAERLLKKAVSAFTGHSGPVHAGVRVSAPQTLYVDAPTTPSQSGGVGGGAFVFPTRSSAPGTPSHVPIDAKDVLAAGIAQLGVSEAAHVDVEAPHAHLDGSDRDQYQAVLMDFGSAGPRMVHVASRAQALQLQEDAEANCTATFRAPELWDVPSPCTLDQAAADVWSLGCTLFAAMYGQSPFQISLNQGGSLALAVINCNIPWPKSPSCTYPPELHSLVTRCLSVDPTTRPTAAALAAEAATLLTMQPPLPNPSAYKHS